MLKPWYFSPKTTLYSKFMTKSTFFYFKMSNYYFLTPYLINLWRFWLPICGFARIFLTLGFVPHRSYIVEIDKANRAQHYCLPMKLATPSSGVRFTQPLLTFGHPCIKNQIVRALKLLFYTKKLAKISFFPGNFTSFFLTQTPL